MLTHPVETQQIGGDSAWQNGPGFLKLTVEAWPVNPTNEAELSDTIGQTLACDIKTTVMHNDKMDPNLNIFNLTRFSSHTKLLKVTSRVVAAIKAKPSLAIAKNVSSQDMQETEKLWA